MAVTLVYSDATKAGVMNAALNVPVRGMNVNSRQLLQTATPTEFNAKYTLSMYPMSMHGKMAIATKNAVVMPSA